jgi:hypothetical protein
VPHYNEQMKILSNTLIILFLFLFACNTSREKIPLNVEFIEKETMFLLKLNVDSLIFTPLTKSFHLKKYRYELHDDTLKIYDFNGYGLEKLIIRFMNNDSIKLTDLTPDSIPVFKRDYTFYQRNLLYDSTLFVKSIVFEKSIVKGGYAEKAFTINDTLGFFIRKDIGIIESPTGHFTHTMTDYEGTLTDSTFDYIQDLIRLLDFDFIDENFGDYSSKHIYWNVLIEYKNGKKYQKEGVDITDNLAQIWYYIFNDVSESIELTELKQIEGIEWTSKK